MSNALESISNRRTRRLPFAPACLNRLFLCTLLLGLPAIATVRAAEPGVTGAGQKSDVVLEVLPLKREYFDASAVEVLFSYTVGRNRPDGTAEVRMRNVDTGEDLIKRFSIPLSVGKHHAWARWGGDGPDTSSSDSEIDELLGGDISHAGLPDGLYVPQVILEDASGQVLVEHQASADNVKQLSIAGKTLRVVSEANIERKARQARDWLAELETLEARARAAGADVSRPRIFVTAVRETLRQLPGRRSSKEYELILENHGYIERHMPEARRQLERASDAPRQMPRAAPLPCPEGRMTVRDGSYWAGDQPVFMGGLCMFSLWMDDLPVIRELGYNVIHVFCSSASVFPTPDSPPGVLRLGDLAGSPEKNFPVRELLDRCQELGLKVDLGLLPNPPDWFFEQHPDARATGQSVAEMINYDIEHPDALEFIERFYDAAMPQLAGHPALNTIWLVNEPMYWNASQRHAAAFSEHLKAKYETIEALNQSWGTTLTSFNGIKGLPPRPGPTMPPEEQVAGAALAESIGALRRADQPPDELTEELKAVAGDIVGGLVGKDDATPKEPTGDVQLGVNWGSQGMMNFDLWNFNMGRLTHHFEWLTTLVHKHDPDVRTAFKLNNLQMGWYVPVGNVDQEAVSDLTPVIGMDSGTYPFAKPYYDWLRSLDPDKPLVNLEFKAGHDRTQLDFWKAVLSFGVAGADWWAWHPKAIFATAMSHTVSLHQGALAASDIQRLWPQVRAFHVFPRSPFVVVYPDPVRPRAWHYFNEGHDSTVHALKQLGYAVDYATEKRIADGRLKDFPYRIVVLPAADFIRDETLSRIEAFVHGGGIAVVVGEPPRHDELGRPRTIAWLEPPAGTPRAIENVEGSAVFPHGSGKVWRIPILKNRAEPVQQDLVPPLREIASRELPPPPVKIVSPYLPIRRFDRIKGFEALPMTPTEGAAEWPSGFENRTIEWTNASGDPVLLTYLFNEDKVSAFRLEATFAVPVTGGIDLISGESIDPACIEIDPWGVRLIEWRLRR